MEIGHTPKVLDGNSDNWWEDRVRKKDRVSERGAEGRGGVRIFRY